MQKVRQLICCLLALVVIPCMACDKSKVQRVVSAAERIERVCPRLDNLVAGFAANGTLDAQKATQWRAALATVQTLAAQIAIAGASVEQLDGDRRTQFIGLLRVIADNLGSLNSSAVFIKNVAAQNRFAAALTVGLVALDEIEALLGIPIRASPVATGP